MASSDRTDSMASLKSNRLESDGVRRIEPTRWRPSDRTDLSDGVRRIETTRWRPSDRTESGQMASVARNKKRRK
eukprot:3632820-Pyramimonas_sp.AAC.1